MLFTTMFGYPSKGFFNVKFKKDLLVGKSVADDVRTWNIPRDKTWADLWHLSHGRVFTSLVDSISDHVLRRAVPVRDRILLALLDSVKHHEQ